MAFIRDILWYDESMDIKEPWRNGGGTITSPLSYLHCLIFYFWIYVLVWIKNKNERFWQLTTLFTKETKMAISISCGEVWNFKKYVWTTEILNCGWEDCISLPFVKLIDRTTDKIFLEKMLIYESNECAEKKLGSWFFY